MVSGYEPGAPIVIADARTRVDAEADGREGQRDEWADEDGRHEGGHREVDGHAGRPSIPVQLMALSKSCGLTVDW